MKRMTNVVGNCKAVVYLNFLCLLMSMSACATPTPEGPKPLTAKEQVGKVVQVCMLLHNQHTMDPKYTDCQLRNNELKFVFADQATYRGESQPISQMVRAFCFAGQSSQQRTMTLHYSWMYKKEGVLVRRQCPKVEFVQPAPDFGAPEE